MNEISITRRMAAEAIGTAFLLATVVGSGIMAERLSGGNVAIALLANTLATGAGLVALILTFGPISGAHFNPAVTLADAAVGGLSWREVPQYLRTSAGRVRRSGNGARDVRRGFVLGVAARSEWTLAARE
jgi:glycerol uptake facilitator-like aquaporin